MNESRYSAPTTGVQNPIVSPLFRFRSIRMALLQCLMLTLIAATTMAGSAEQLYQQALDHYRVLDKQPQRHRDRAPWVRCIEGFQQVLQHDPAGELAPKCLFLIAQSYHHLYHSHMMVRDGEAAIKHYRALLEEFPNHSLADDALYMLGIFYLDELHDRTAAQTELQNLVQQFPNSELIPRATEKLVQLEPSRDSRQSLRRQAGKKSMTAARKTVGDAPPAAPTTPPVVEGKTVAPIVSAPLPTTKTTEKTALTPLATGKRRSKPAPAQTKGGVPTLAQQLGLGIGRIVLDPGHGGKDTGAISPSGLREKDIVLNIAKMLKTTLERETGCQVLLTRSTDRYLTLAERTAFANAKKADVFVSVHANASENRSLGGVETYFLNLASDPQAARVAALENASAHKRMSDLQSILKDLVLKSKTNESSRLAHDVQNRIVTRLRERYKDTRDLGVKQAPFLVLVGAEMPAILVETAFLSNEQEEVRLADTDFQNTLSRGIAAGVTSYIQHLSAERPISTASR